jgi:hypothetical protein
MQQPQQRHQQAQPSLLQSAGGWTRAHLSLALRLSCPGVCVAHRLQQHMAAAASLQCQMMQQLRKQSCCKPWVSCCCYIRCCTDQPAASSLLSRVLASQRGTEALHSPLPLAAVAPAGPAAHVSRVDQHPADVGGVQHIPKNQGVWLGQLRSVAPVALSGLCCAGAEVQRLRPVSITHPEHPVNVARRRASEVPGAVFADQFENLANLRAHLDTGVLKTAWGSAPSVAVVHVLCCSCALYRLLLSCTCCSRGVLTVPVASVCVLQGERSCSRRRVACTRLCRALAQAAQLQACRRP